MTCIMEIIPMVTTGVCITHVPDTSGTGNKWQVTVKSGGTGLCKRCFISWTDVPCLKVNILTCYPKKKAKL